MKIKETSVELSFASLQIEMADEMPMILMVMIRIILIKEIDLF